MSSATRFGSPSTPLSAASGVLRARAAGAGMDLAEAPDVDLAAAVVAADAWAMLVRSESLSTPSRHGPTAVRTLAAILARAAGHPTQSGLPDLSECAQDPDMLAAAEGHYELAGSLYPRSRTEVLLRAASDLGSAGSGTRFSSYAALLMHVL